MTVLGLVLSLVAFGLGIGSLSVAVFIWSKHRTPLLGAFVIFDSALFLFTLAFAVRGIAGAGLWAAQGSVHETQMSVTAATLVAVGNLLQGAGASALTAILPYFAWGLFDRRPGLWHSRVGLGSALVLAILVVAGGWSDHGASTGVTASVLLFGNLGLCAVLVGRLVSGPTGLVRPLIPLPTLKRFLYVSAAFLPLFIGDAFFLGTKEAGALRWLDNTSVPLYFILLNLGTFTLARRSLDHPPLLENDRVSEFGRERYGLTDRESQVLEYVIDGYTLKDLAGVIGMAAKTAENHLQNVYRKTGVNNRIQLFQIFHNQRRLP